MFDIEFENSIISQSMRDDTYLRDAVRLCDTHHFGTKEHSWVWGVIKDVWEKYHERVNPKLVIARAREDFRDESKRKPYLSLALKLFKTKPSSPKSALAELHKFIREVNVQLAVEQATEALEKGKTDDAESALLKVSRLSVTARPYTHISWVEGFEERQAARRYEREHPEEFTCIPTGIPRLDAAMSGGSRLGELGLVMGTTGRGKSVMCSNLIHSAIRRRFPSAYFGMEMRARQIATRQDARWSGLKYDQFKKYEFMPSELRQLKLRYERAKKQYANMLHIISMPIKSATILTIRSALDDLMEEYDFRPKLIVIDSGDHLRSTDKSLESYRLQQADVYWQMKRLAEEEGYVVWSSVHAGREYAKQLATAEATAESYDKARIADTVFSLNDPFASKRKKVVISDDEDDDEDEEEVKPPTDTGKRRLEGFLGKYRDGESNLKIPLDCDFSRMLIREAGSPEEGTKKEAA